MARVNFDTNRNLVPASQPSIINLCATYRHVYLAVWPGLDATGSATDQLPFKRLELTSIGCRQQVVTLIERSWATQTEERLSSSWEIACEAAAIVCNTINQSKWRPKKRGKLIDDTIAKWPFFALMIPLRWRPVCGGFGFLRALVLGWEFGWV